MDSVHLSMPDPPAVPATLPSTPSAWSVMGQLPSSSPRLVSPTRLQAAGHYGELSSGFFAWCLQFLICSPHFVVLSPLLTLEKAWLSGKDVQS